MFTLFIKTATSIKFGKRDFKPLILRLKRKASTGSAWGGRGAKGDREGRRGRRRRKKMKDELLPEINVKLSQVPTYYL